ncbi:MAG: hypothetical protein UY00_C0009G0009 [Candidatus Wolfebacteria bacterium GW2011_GWA1_47_6]|nr:MAG: hypothetical protein UY00_C0009G0009 [Candidatus Wolfebacteria bacterium GW2011_GWA1_47_6]
MAQKNKQPLYRNVLDLMQKKTAGVMASHQAEKDLMQLGELLASSSSGTRRPTSSHWRRNSSMRPRTPRPSVD